MLIKKKVSVINSLMRCLEINFSLNLDCTNATGNHILRTQKTTVLPFTIGKENSRSRSTQGRIAKEINQFASLLVMQVCESCESCE